MDSIDGIAIRLKELEQKRELLAQCFRQTDSAKITRFKLPISPIQLDDIKICGVDGGFLKKEYHGVGLILRRAVAVCFDYKDSKLTKAEYLPSKMPIPEVIVAGPEYSDTEFNLFANLCREEIELKTCIEAVEKFSPNVLIRDGSIVLYPSNLPEKSSRAYAKYKKVVLLVKELYHKCEEKNILLVGAVEDSKGKRYCNIIIQEAIPALLRANITVETLKRINDCKDVLENTTDTLFLYNLLNVGERTTVLDYSKTSDLPILKDLEEFSKKIFVTYIKAAEFDRPLRLDFLSSFEKLDENAGKISAIVFEISKQNRMYSFPSILIEADARAKLSENDILYFKEALSEKLGRSPSLLDLRRELRPF
jgi:hypothetical protein